MDKTVSISLGGYAFTLDEAAYHKLKSYLDDIRRSLNSTEGIDEIISDVESRIAELLQSSVKNKEVVNIQNIDDVVAVMGKPEEYSDEDTEETSGRRSYDSSNGTYKKLYRDQANGWIGGVCSGLAKYFSIDPLWVRLIFVSPIILSFIDIGLSFGFFFITYIVLWIIVPEAKSTADRLSMIGKPVNFDSIKEFTEQTADNVSKVAADAKPVAGRVIEVVGKIILAIFGIYLFTNGLGFIIGGLAATIGSFVGLSQIGHYGEYFFNNSWVVILGINLIAICLILIGIALILVALRLFSKRYKLKGKTFLIMGILFLMSFIGAAVIGISYSSHFWHQEQTSEAKTYTINNDTIYLSTEKFKKYQDDHKRWRSFNSDFFVDNDQLYVDNIDVNVYESDDSEVKIELEFESQGQNWEDAVKNANNVNYNYKVEENHIILDEFYTIKEGDKFRGQDVKIKIYIPEGKIIHSKNLNWFDIYYGDHYNHRHGKKGKNYQILEDEVVCFNCEDDDEYHHSNRHSWEDRLEERLEEKLEGLDIDEEDVKDINVKIDENGINIDISTDDEDKATRKGGDVQIKINDSISITNDNDSISIDNNGN